MTTTVNAFTDLPAVEVNGTRLAYREAGEGSPVVFVHGGESDLRTWNAQLAAPAPAFRYIAYSRRYARPNADIAAGMDDQMLPHVEDLAVFIDTVAGGSAHLVGNSWGAFICLLTALRYPDKVLSLVLEEPPVLPLVMGPGNSPSARSLIRSLVRAPRATVAVLHFGATTMAKVQKAFRAGDDDVAMWTFLHGVLGEDVLQGLPEERKQQMRENNSALKAQMLGAGFPALTRSQVRRITTPTLVVVGERSPAFLPALADLLLRLLPHATRVVIPAASHAMHEEQPSTVNRAIAEFLASVSG